MEKFEHTWVITAHGKSAYLEECIQSIKNQTVPSKIIMSTATDNDLIRSLSEKYEIPVYVKGEPDEVRDNWNFAYNLAQGNWVTLAHQDDLYEPAYVAELQKTVEGQDDASIFFTDYQPFGNDSKQAIANRDIQTWIKYPLTNRWIARRKWARCLVLAVGNSICCPTVSFHKTLLGTDLFKTHPSKDIHENLDWEMWITLAKRNHAFAYNPAKLVHYRLHNAQASSQYMKSQQRSAEDYECFRLLWPDWIARILVRIYAKAYDVYK